MNKWTNAYTYNTNLFFYLKKSGSWFKTTLLPQIQLVKSENKGLVWYSGVMLFWQI